MHVPVPAGSELVADADAVDAALDRLAATLQPEVDAGDCVLLAVLLGGMIPAARLAGRLRGDFLLDYCQVTRYRGGRQGGELDWLQPPQADLRGRSVLVVDDIYDEGITLDFVAAECRRRGASRVLTAVLAHKKTGRMSLKGPDHVGLEVPDRYVFGCGMDLAHRWRHLPAIYAAKDGD